MGDSTFKTLIHLSILLAGTWAIGKLIFKRDLMVGVSWIALYISGVNAAPIYHSHPHKSEEFNQLDFSPEGQAKLTMENLNSILRSAGGTFSDIVQLFVFIVDAQKNGDRIRENYLELLG